MEWLGRHFFNRRMHAYASPFLGRLSFSSLLAFSFSYLPSNGSLPVLFASSYGLNIE